MASAMPMPRAIWSPTVSRKNTAERSQLPHTAPSENSRDQLSSPTQSNEIPPIIRTDDRLIAMM
jgi:hypothetical protein